MSESLSFNNIGDALVNTDTVYASRSKFMNDAYKLYTKANVLLGYFSQLRDYDTEYQCLLNRVMQNRKDILARYKDLLTKDNIDTFKQLLILPTNNKWYLHGIHKYKKVKNYSVYYYRRKIYVVLEEETTDIKTLKKIIETIILLDKYYDIYEEIIIYFMQTSTKFEQIMRKHFSDHIHL